MRLAHYYTLSLDMFSDIFSWHAHSSWILGDEHCEVTVLELRPESRIPTKVHLTKWPLNEPPPKHGTLKPNPFARHPGDLGEILQEPYLPPKIVYTDKSLVCELLTRHCQFIWVY